MTNKISKALVLAVTLTSIACTSQDDSKSEIIPLQFQTTATTETASQESVPAQQQAQTTTTPAAIQAQTENAASVTKAELKLIAPLEETRGWCVDLFAHLTNAIPIGGFQAHNCFYYMGNGVTEDQGFDAQMINEEGRIRIVYFDMCMTLHEPNPGSFVATEACNDGEAQNFDIKDTGEIVPVMASNLCLTIGPRTVTGGGGSPIHLIRKLSFETCDESISDRQQWELRLDGAEYVEATPTMPRPYN